MNKSYQNKHVYLAIAVVIAVFSPILYFFLPQTLADIFHNREGVWFVSVPEVNFKIFAVGFGLLFISSFILFLLDVRKLSVSISIVFLLLAAGTFYIASQSYILLSDENITYNPFLKFERETYSWDEVERVIHHRTEMGDISNYEFVFEDGKSVIIEDSSYFRNRSFKFNKRLAESNLSVDFQLIEE